MEKLQQEQKLWVDVAQIPITDHFLNPYLTERQRFASVRAHSERTLLFFCQGSLNVANTFFLQQEHLFENIKIVGELKLTLKKKTILHTNILTALRFSAH